MPIVTTSNHKKEREVTLLAFILEVQKATERLQHLLLIYHQGQVT